MAVSVISLPGLSNVANIWSSVYKLRCKVAEPGTIVPPPSDADGLSKASTGKKQASLALAEEEEDQSDSASSEDEEQLAPEFKAEQCLFCPLVSDTFESNASHMKSAHNLTIPYESSLSVDLVTLIWYLHLVIFSYHECIFCGTRRRTVEAVQQHILGKGHCRFQLEGEMLEFYDLEGREEFKTDGLVNVDGESMRLPSGKILAHRSQTTSTKPRTRSQQSSTSHQQLSSPPPEPTGESQADALTTRDQKDASLATQLLRLSVNDQRSLAHLPVSQQRSLLATQRKQMDLARKAEKRVQRRVDQVPEKPNKTMLKTALLKVAMQG